ncbi:ankyrin repeat and MYND domain-containing protein 2-like [Ornithodoros turicata]|uniref:ankyrin repeat and MYND domain-containing protein 2-like n=1 Tax=Ornithodoros turicata TaxID=34597 RepID=UPI00313860D4
MAVKQGDLTESETALHKAVQEGDVAQVRTLLNNVRIDCLDENGMTPLQHAAYRGNYELCKIILECGADVNSHYHDSGYTALMFAGLAGKCDVVSLLLEHGASTTAVNTLGRTASQMAAFVSNYDVVSIINNFLPKEELEYYTRPHGLEKEPKLPIALCTPLYHLVLRTNIHPVSIALYLQERRKLLVEDIERVLKLLCEKQMKASSEPNEMLALKFHHLAFVVGLCRKADDMQPLIKSWLKGRDEDGFPVQLEKVLRQCVREFPYRECGLLQQLVHTLSAVQIGDEPSAISILTEAVRGQKGLDQSLSCTTCGEPKAEKRCASCKSVQYCGPPCQRLHWFTHKKHCARLGTEYKKQMEALRQEEVQPQSAT